MLAAAEQAQLAAINKQEILKNKSEINHAKTTKLFTVTHQRAQ